ncbi:glycosyltransferase family 2 protein [Synechococcus sp. EJ6-Ellesmere]|nr:glycosyltransferase family 2 protein [Synechococcus sp. EJ6-Ellesmere]
MPQVSVVVPFRDQGSMLVQACRSLQAQSLPDWECLLVDDGSAAQARRVAAGLVAADPRFRLLSVPQRDHFPGPWLARNRGIAAARAPLVAFLDADDLWHPAKLELQLALHNGADLDLSVTGYYRYDDQTMRIREVRRPPAAVCAQSLFRGNTIPLSTVLIRRSLVLEEVFRAERHEDYGLWLRLFAAVPPPRYGRLAKPLMAYRLHGASLSSQRALSVVAVEQLFRLHWPDRGPRLLAVGRWLIHRLLAWLRCRWAAARARPDLLPADLASFLT